MRDSAIAQRYACHLVLLKLMCMNKIRDLKCSYKEHILVRFFVFSLWVTGSISQLRYVGH